VYYHLTWRYQTIRPCQLSKDVWAELKDGIPIDENLRHIANNMRKSTSISVLDTSAFTFAEMGDKETALEIYEFIEFFRCSWSKMMIQFLNTKGIMQYCEIVFLVAV